MAVAATRRAGVGWIFSAIPAMHLGSQKERQLRSLGIPRFRDRVIQLAVNLMLQAVFEADIKPSQHGFRFRRDAKDAVRQGHEGWVRDVVDTDLRGYCNTIPSGHLMIYLAQRISGRHGSRLIKQWLELAVVVLIDGNPRRTSEAKPTYRGSAQGVVIKPLLVNV